MKSRKQPSSALPNPRHRSRLGSSLAPRSKPHSRSLRVEPLEDRCLLSLFVANSEGGTGRNIQAYDAVTGAFEGNFATLTNPGSATGMAFSSQGDLFVNNYGNGSVERFNGNTGAPEGVFVAPHSGGLQTGNAITFGPDGNLYVAESSSSTVLRYSGSTGAFIDPFVTAGAGALSSIGGLTFGPDGNLYIPNELTISIERYQGPTKASPGQFMDVFADLASMSGIPGVARFAADGNLYVGFDVINAQTSERDHFLGRFNGTTGAFIDDFAPSGLVNPGDLAFAPNGDIFIADGGDNSVKDYNGVTGAYIGNFVSPGANGLSIPWSIDFHNVAPVANSLTTSATYLTPVDVDLRNLASDYETPVGLLTFTVGSAAKGTVTLLPDGHTARFTPNDPTGGPGGFSYSVQDQANGGPVNTVSAAVTVNYAAGGTLSAGLDAPNGNLVVSDLAGDTGNHVTLSLSGANVLVYDPGNFLTPGLGMTLVDPHTVSIPLASIGGNIQATAGTSPDVLTVDFTGGNPIPAAGLQLTGNGTNSALALEGGSFVTETYTFTGPHSGSIQLTPSAGSPTLITYSGLTPLANSGTPANIIFNLPANSQAALQDDGTAGNGLSLLHSVNGTFEDTTFSSPASSLTVVPGAVHNTIDLHGLDSTFLGSLTIGQSDSAVVTGSVTLAANLNIAAALITNTAAANLSVAGNASFSGPSIDLGNQGGDTMNFGTLTFNSAGGVSIAEDSATVLAGASTADSLVLTSVASITNTASASLTVTNNASLWGTSITLGNQAGDTMNFGTLRFTSAGFVSIAEDSATVLAAGTSTADSLVLTSTASITNAGTPSTSLTVTNNASFSGSSIDLGNQTGDVMNFGTLTFNSAGLVSIAEDSATLLFGTSTADSLVLSSIASITNAANASLTVTHNASFSGTSITLGNQTADTMNFGTLTFNATGPVSIAEDSATLLFGTSTADSLVLTSIASITNAPNTSLTVTNNASFSGTSITLGNQTGDTMNFGTLRFNSTGPVSIAEDSATVLVGISTADSLVLSSTASITDAAGASLTVTNNASFSGTSITLGNQAGDTMNFGTLTFNSTGPVSIAEDSATVLVGISTADSLVLSSTASITNAANASLTVTHNASFSGTSITLGNQTADTMNFGTLTFNSAGGVSIAENSATVLAGTSTADSLVLTSIASITNAGTPSASLTVTNNASFSAPSIDVGNQTADTMNFGTLTFNATGPVSIAEDSATLLFGTARPTALY